MCSSPAQGCDGAAEAAAKLEGVEKVLHARRRAPMRAPLAEPMAALIVSLAGAYDAIRRAGDHQRQELHAARGGAARRDADLRHHRGRWRPDTFVRPIYAGNAIQTVQSSDAKKIITVRTDRFQAGRAKAVRRRSRRSRRGRRSAASPPSSAKIFRKSERPELTSAKIIISGGRGMQNGENFKLLDPLADKLGAAVGAIARRGRCGLCAERLPGRPDRQGRRARSLYRGRHFRRHPASGRHEGLARSSSPSTRTKKRRSSRWPTMALSPTSSQPCPSSRRNSANSPSRDFQTAEQRVSTHRAVRLSPQRFGFRKSRRPA